MLNNIAVEYSPATTYPDIPPFNPPELFPEYRFKEISQNGNSAYTLVRRLLKNLGLDESHYGTAKWNPFGGFISPGSRVLIKPNWVRDKNPLSDDISGLVTHPSIIRAVTDFVLIALDGKGEIIIGDAPIQSADFNLLLSRLGINDIIGFYSERTDVKISVEDFRREIKTYSASGSITLHEIKDDRLFTEVNLAADSFFTEIEGKHRKFRITNYNPEMMLKYHGPGKNIYLIAKQVLDSDVIIHLPKLKTHRKAGITCCLKNTVGINCAKDALVHHLRGSRSCGGDAYPHFSLLKSVNESFYELREKTRSNRFRKILTTCIGINDGIMKKLGLNRFFEGSWHGNSTLWRMILDINNILYFAGPDGKMSEKEQRKVFYLVDGITGGEGEGPLRPSNRAAGLLIGTFNPVAGDMAAASLIGFSDRKVTVIRKALENKILGFGESEAEKLTVNFNGEEMNYIDLPAVELFEPSAGWKNYIEKEN